MTAPFILHPQLAADTIHLGNFPLSCVLLMNNALVPWFILVPKIGEIREIHQLADEQQCQLIRESSSLASAMETLFVPQKLNIAALGNMVPQLHVHHIARYHHDPAWPNPVWGRIEQQPYAEKAINTIAEDMSHLLAERFIPALRWNG